MDGLNHHEVAFNFARHDGDLLLERESDIAQVFTLNGITGGHE